MTLKPPSPSPSPSPIRGPAPALCAGLFATAVMALAPQPAQAAFGAESAEIWSARSLRIAEAVGKPVATSTDVKESEAIGNSYFSGVKQACTGITGEHIRYGGKNMPVWAQTAQQHFCLGAGNLFRAYSSGKKDKGYCRDLKSAIGYARKAKPGEDPENVVAAAQALIGATEALINTKVTLQKWSVLGTSSLSFSC